MPMRAVPNASLGVGHGRTLRCLHIHHHRRPDRGWIHTGIWRVLERDQVMERPPRCQRLVNMVVPVASLGTLRSTRPTHYAVWTGRQVRKHAWGADNVATGACQRNRRYSSSTTCTGRY